MDSAAIVVTLIASLLSGIIGVLVSAHHYRKYDKEKLKRDVLRRLAGNRHLLTVVPCEAKGEPFIALNEAFIVFSDSPKVIAALKKMHDELRQSERLVDNIVTLIKTMAEAANVSVNILNDSFIECPFSPRKGAVSLQK
ncbi:MAG: hypothetical protein IT583_04120 [Verrucomicrobia bacterium]|nr:hypothetical protein [Verrucomicrobiota bacterium]